MSKQPQWLENQLQRAFKDKDRKIIRLLQQITFREDQAKQA